MRILLALVGLAIVAPTASAADWSDLGLAHSAPITDGDRWLVKDLGRGHVLVRDEATRKTTQVTVGERCVIGPISPGGVLLSKCGEPSNFTYEAIFLATGARQAFAVPQPSGPAGAYATAVGRHWIEIQDEGIDSRRTVLRNLSTGAARTVDGKYTVTDLDAWNPARRLCSPLMNTPVPIDRAGNTVWGGLLYRDRVGLVTAGQFAHVWHCGHAKPDKRELPIPTRLGAGWAVSLDFRRGVSAFRVRGGRTLRWPIPAVDRLGLAVAHTRRSVYLSLPQLGGGTRVFKASLPTR